MDEFPWPEPVSVFQFFPWRFVAGDAASEGSEIWRVVRGAESPDEAGCGLLGVCLFGHLEYLEHRKERRGGSRWDMGCWTCDRGGLLMVWISSYRPQYFAYDSQDWSCFVPKASDLTWFDQSDFVINYIDYRLQLKYTKIIPSPWY